MLKRLGYGVAVSVSMVLLGACGGVIELPPDDVDGTNGGRVGSSHGGGDDVAGFGGDSGEGAGWQGRGGRRVCGQPIVINDCGVDEGYEVSSYRGVAGEPELHVIGVYETHSDHGYGSHPRGRATVRVERKGHHILALSSYEPVDYELTVLPGAVVDAVILDGYYRHTVDAPPGTRVINRSGEGYPSACGYVYPSDDQGCDTPALLQGVEQIAGQPVTSFAGCYRASDFVIRDDETCDDERWVEHPFQYDRAQSDCEGGAQYVRYEPRYAKWVGAELCSPTRYKLFLGEERDGVFHEIGDSAGHGQDHCELANRAFSIPDDDDITSGGCSTCDVAMAPWERPGAVPVYSRGYFGEAFELEAWPEHGIYTSRWYECGVAIP